MTNIVDGAVMIAPEEARRFNSYFEGAEGFTIWLMDEVMHPVTQAFEGHPPKRLVALSQSVHQVQHNLRHAPPGSVRLGAEVFPILRRAALHFRHKQALLAERLHVVGVDVEHASEIDALTAEVDAALALPWLRDVAPLPRPRLTEYVNLKKAREILAKRGKSAVVGRVYDEKFGILWAPSSCMDAIEASRTESWLLGTSTCVAYVDIDDFKKVNTLMSETRVDREVLPPFMMLLEAHTSSRGYAFRYGGDEYVVLFPNADENTARALLESTRADIAKRTFGGQRLTTSIGFVVVPDDCPLTNTEILSRANLAKNDAKSAGKNRVQGAAL